MNTIKLGIVLDESAPEFSENLTFLPAGLPGGWFSIGFYRPRSDTFQKGDDFNWLVHGMLDFEGAAWNSWLSGLRYRTDFYFHDSGASSSSYRGELYFAYQAPAGTFETHITHYFSDTQPFRSLDGETYWGIRFIW